MAIKDLSDELNSIIGDDDSSLNDDINDIQEHVDSPEDEMDKSNRKSKIIAVVAAVAALLIGVFIGSILFGGSGEVQRPTVTSVNERLPIYRQLESMRENTISTLNKEIGDLSASDGTNVNQQYYTSLAVNRMHGDLTAIVDPFIGEIVLSGKTCDDMMAYVNDTGTLSVNETNSIKSVFLSIADYVQMGDDGFPDIVMAGESPEKTIGASVQKVSMSSVSVLAMSANDSKQTGTVYLVSVPVATENGELYNAIYIVGVQSSNSKVVYCGYVGVVRTTDAGLIAKATTDAASIVLLSQEDIAKLNGSDYSYGSGNGTVNLNSASSADKSQESTNASSNQQSSDGLANGSGSSADVGAGDKQADASGGSANAAESSE